MLSNIKIGSLVKVDLSKAFEGLPPTNDNDQNIGIVIDIHRDINNERSFGIQLGSIYEYFEADAILEIK